MPILPPRHIKAAALICVPSWFGKLTTGGEFQVFNQQHQETLRRVHWKKEVRRDGWEFLFYHDVKSAVAKL